MMPGRDDPFGAGALAHSAVVCSVVWVNPDKLPPAEFAEVQSVVAAIESGQQPSGDKGKKWGTTYWNRDGSLPEKLDANGNPIAYYKEYRVLVTGSQNVLRIVTGQQGEMYYTWTHYGDIGDPAFVRIR
jgi:guanyl-specific ribonuclease Sa